MVRVTGRSWMKWFSLFVWLAAIVLVGFILYLNRSGVEELFSSARIRNLFAVEKDRRLEVFEAVNLALTDAGVPPSRWFNQDQGRVSDEQEPIVVRTQVRANSPVERDLINYYTTIRLGKVGGRVIKAREISGLPWPGLEILVGYDSSLVRILDVKPSPSRRPSMTGPRIALIVDDFGQFFNKTIEGFIDLEVPITIAIIPRTPFAGQVAQLARDRGREFMVHLPMEPREYPQKNPGNQAVLVSMSPGEIREVVEEAIGSLPGAAGLNNHMGSRATEYSEVMRAVMDACLTSGLYFIDSMTSPRSIAYRVGREMGVRAGHNELFLDNDHDEPSIERSLSRLVRIARQQGRAIGIAHPFSSTYRVFERLLPQYQADGVNFVTVSQLLAN